MTVMVSANRVWVDGCFDFTHHGHAGALLQARRTVTDPPLGELYCGVHTDEAITLNKGPPVMHTRERYAHAASIRWCTRVVEDAPYVTEPAWLDRYGCKFVVHGDDITTDAQGYDCYQEVKDIGRFKMVKRTYGVSTTDIIHRILTGARCDKEANDCRPTLEELQFYSRGNDGFAKHCQVFDRDIHTLLVSSETFQFDPTSSLLIVGDFDLFHMGHIEQLQNARDGYPNSKIIVGIQDDQDNIMSLKERVLSVLSCCYVDGVILNPDMRASVVQCFGELLNIDSAELISSNPTSFSSYLTKQVIVDRIEKQRDLFITRNKNKGMNV
ncbi:ethanolamine-phosphate cytidylyltransferase KNAG_0D03350 [Huiozyma naganishii CBS 8797]|uniref:ethanolamine-phosphate cytidylyltransferase n=1 Tax=Huiozyma naganishii (strain ATCC MYA-139 / BCRC 22969 / CBS 8797 / KCTC 17520 / NBRC 10181 / NCYC 3082 / Yp74L-3) TaxID=1071383 RepID=J7RY78_HUIN7|nr:hypothetical protein KNAG_0D03350 [Kazachstania naganishii CBS 8797]CCK70082.1 hypothetical protein KNAG_0D03350 [Kazachstania naganishii CBS 8797]